MDKKYLKNRQLLILIVVLVGIINPLFAAGSSDSIQWAMLVFSLFGGLALFLFGMEQMSEGMKKTAGDKILGTLPYF